MYRADRVEDGSRQRHRRRVWLVLVVIFITLIVLLVVYILHHLKPHTVIRQSKAVTSQGVVATKTRHYDEPGFGIDLPVDWQVVPSQPGPYRMYNWRSSDGQLIEIYQDTIPTNFAINNVLIVEAEVDHLQLDGNVSDNCSKFTKSLVAAPHQVGVPAKWQDVDFICDQSNQQRNVVGTSSLEGVNTVTLRQPAAGSSHKYFITYTSFAVTVDYDVFYNALTSLQAE